MPVQPRKTFAPSFVLTVVGSVAVAGAQPAPAKPRPPISKKPPAPEKKPPPKKPPPAPTADRHYHYMQMDKKCMAHDLDACAMPNRKPTDPVPPCNPPPPMAVACPENLSLPQKVVQKAGSLDCYVDWGPMSCPKDAKCNPPAPRKVACPTPFSPPPD